MTDPIDKAFDRAAAPRPGDEDDCPVIALGHRNGTYYFLSMAGEKREMRPRDMTYLGLLSLFNGNATWLHEHYAKLDKRDRKTADIDVNDAAAAMMRRCATVGLWREDTPLRSVGVWLDRERGAVAHCGDLLFWYDGKGRRVSKPAGVHRGHAVYVAAPSISPPSAKPATPAMAKTLLEALDLWNFAAPHLARLTFGFIAAAMLGEAVRWRVHVLLTGKRGSGKTTLIKLIVAVLGDLVNDFNDPTEAGLRELLTNEARVLVFDEAGATGGEDKSIRVDAIIGLLRRMADEGGARSVRGTGSGAKQYHMAGAALLGAANPPILDAQDRSRILEVDLLPATASNRAAVELAIAAMMPLSSALRARALVGYQRFVDNLQVYRQALIEQGCDARQADQLGTLFAGAEMMESDTPIDSDSAAAEVAALGGVIRIYRDEDDELSNGRRCYGVLMSSQVEHWKGGAKSTIGRLVQLGLDESRTDERDALAVYGVRLVVNDAGERELWVANQHRGLDKLFGGTDWRNGAWKRALLQLPGTVAAEAPRQFAGHKSRFVIIPASYLPKPAPRPQQAGPPGPP